MYRSIKCSEQFVNINFNVEHRGVIASISSTNHNSVVDTVAVGGGLAQTYDGRWRSAAVSMAVAPTRCICSIYFNEPGTLMTV